jgi:urate oxidase
MQRVESSPMPAILTSHSYGKSRVRLTRVTRLSDRHEVRELTADVRLEGDFADSYTLGDNRRIIATDTMKNVIYALAQGRPAEAIEDFAAALAGHFVESHDHVEAATVRLEEHSWRRIEVGAVESPHAFVGAGSEVRTTSVRRNRQGARVESGLDNLQVLKTTGSGFAGFVRDAYTTLPETTDRIFATDVRASWLYELGSKVDWDEAHRGIRTSLLECFAVHESLSVQQTLHAMGVAALEACGALEEITLTMPNKHRILVDLQRFGRENVNEIFVATDEPFGLITGTLRRA